MPATITELTTDATSGNQFISESLFDDWSENYTDDEPAVYVMSNALLDDLDNDFLGNSNAVAITFYFGNESSRGERVLLLTGTADSGSDIFNSNQVYYLQAGVASSQSTGASNAASWANAYKTAIGGSYTTANPGAFIFYKGYFNNLRNQAGVAMIKVIRGVDGNGDNVIMLAAADSSGNILGTLTYQYLEKSRPCPPYTGCGSATSTDRSNHQF